MADTMDIYNEWLAKMLRLRNALAHIPYAARHQKEQATPLFMEIDAAANAGDLPDGLLALWQQHRSTLIAAGTAAQDFADTFDAAYPVVATRPAGS